MNTFAWIMTGINLLIAISNLVFMITDNKTLKRIEDIVKSDFNDLEP